jgi:hypothetical protein
VPDDPDSRDKPRSGRVRHDSGGRAIWEWALDSGKQAVDSTSRLLKKLELTGITLMGDEARPWEKQKQNDASRKPASSTGDIKTQTSGQATGHSRDSGPPGHGSGQDRSAQHDAGKSRGTNPYDSRTPVGRSAPTPKKPAAAAPRITQPPARKPGLLARLLGRR